MTKETNKNGSTSSSSTTSEPATNTTNQQQPGEKFVRKHTIKIFNTASIKELTPFRTVIDGLVVHHRFASEGFKKLHKLEKEEELDEVSEGDEESGGDQSMTTKEEGEEEEGERCKKNPRKKLVDVIFPKEKIQATIPAFLYSQSPVFEDDEQEEAEEGDYRCETGVLIPIDRLSLLRGYLQRRHRNLFFVPLQPIRGKDESLSPSSTSSSSSSPSSSSSSSSSEGKEKFDSITGFQPNKEKGEYLYIPCAKGENPWVFLQELWRFIASMTDYENWYYNLKGVRVKPYPVAPPDLSNPSSASSPSSSSPSSTPSVEDYDPLLEAAFFPLTTPQVRELHHLCNLHKQHSGYRGGDVKKSPGDEALAEKYITLMQKNFEQYCRIMGNMVACPPPTSSETTTDFFQHLEKAAADLNEEENVTDHITNWNKRGVFMRLSARSPKDYGPHLLVASLSGKDIFDRVVKSSRSRVSLSEHLQSKDPAKSSHIIFMPWMDDLLNSCEFRCFVHNKSLNAISQYDPYHPSPLLSDIKMGVYFRDYIDYFHEQIKDRIPYSSYVMDVVISSTPICPVSLSSSAPSSGEWYCNLIEFNPFFADGSSGASLFDWENDYNIIHKERKPPLLRIRNPYITRAQAISRFAQKTPEVLDLWG